MSSYKSSICRDGFEITPSDTDKFTKEAVLYIGVTGDVVAVTTSGTQLTFKNAQAGSTLPWAIIQVLATGTTATDLVGGTS